MTRTILGLAAFTVAAVLASTISLDSAQAQERDPGERRAPRLERGRPGGGAARMRFRRHLMRARGEVARALELTDDQRRVVLEKARAAEPIVAQGRRDRAKLLVAERDARRARTADAPRPTAEDRAAQRAARRAVREKLAADLAPLAKDVVATLTTEQRARLEGFAAAHGRKVTDETLVRRTSRMLARPMTVPMLEARLSSK